jgi:hypothetical protein
MRLGQRTGRRGEPASSGPSTRREDGLSKQVCFRPAAEKLCHRRIRQLSGLAFALHAAVSSIPSRLKHRTAVGARIENEAEVFHWALMPRTPARSQQSFVTWIQLPPPSAVIRRSCSSPCEGTSSPCLTRSGSTNRRRGEAFDRAVVADAGPGVVATRFRALPSPTSVVSAADLSTFVSRTVDQG